MERGEKWKVMLGSTKRTPQQILGINRTWSPWTPSESTTSYVLIPWSISLLDVLLMSRARIWTWKTYQLIFHFWTIFGIFSNINIWFLGFLREKTGPFLISFRQILATFDYFGRLGKLSFFQQKKKLDSSQFYFLASISICMIWHLHCVCYFC